jgi:formylglycine-generating enzyme required for sulfatase activity
VKRFAFILRQFFSPTISAKTLNTTAKSWPAKPRPRAAVRNSLATARALIRPPSAPWSEGKAIWRPTGHLLTRGGDKCGILSGNMAVAPKSQLRAEPDSGLPAGYVRHLRIFLASPGDVPAERKIAMEVISQLQFEPQFRGKVFLEPVAWDNPGAGTVMRATINPQHAIRRGLGEPAQCDIVIVIFWARMGTRLPDPPYHKASGEPYYSGAEWEYENALEGARRNQRPEVIVYRRTEDPLFSPRDPDFGSKVEQWKLVEEFFARFSDPKTGAILRGCNFYEKPDGFRQQFTKHLRDLVEELLSEPAAPHPPPASPPPELWRGSPFPGLRAFTDKDAPIFFGRGRETDDLVERINRNRFVAVVGASGSGKSSLVWAGLIPALLKGNSIRSERAASSDWLWLRLTPGGVGDNPFMALAAELRPYLPGWEALTLDTVSGAGDQVELRPYLPRWEARDIAAKVAPDPARIKRIKRRRRRRRKAREIAERLEADPKALADLIPQILSGRPDSAELVLFIDQFEELVTVVAERYRVPFAAMLAEAVAGERVRAVATLRGDFYHRMIPISPVLVELLQNGSYPLGAPDPLSLEEMIVRPAERAGLQFDGDLAQRIVRDTGSEPGSLALMAYLLDELYGRTADGRLTRKAYDDLGGVAGAVGQRAEQVFASLSPEAQSALPQVFRRLVRVDDAGTATRRRALRADIVRSAPQAAEELLTKFTEARLLVTDTQPNTLTIEVAQVPLREKAGGTPVLPANATVEVAHEALLRKWARLATWIRQAQNDLRLVDQVKLASDEWERNSRKDPYRWLDERLQALYEAIDRLAIDEEQEFSAAQREFVRRESDRLLEEIQRPETSHDRRRSIGERLAGIGDPRPGVGLRPDGLPNIEWCKVDFEGRSSVEVQIESVGKVRVNLPLYIARYPVTYRQFQAFVEEQDGYHNPEIDWFQGLAGREEDKALGEQRFIFSNHPRETVNWYEAMAFCRWLSWRFEALKHSPSVLGGRASRAPHPPKRPFNLKEPFTCPVRLPTEAEWQFAAAGPSAKAYPWGNDWDGRLANTWESGLSHTTAVGMYPGGAAECGALDMSGNVCEWTLTEWRSGKTDDITNQESRVVRGGSWYLNQNDARASYRFSYHPVVRNYYLGFRVVGLSLLLSSDLCLL